MPRIEHDAAGNAIALSWAKGETFGPSEQPRARRRASRAAQGPSCEGIQAALDLGLAGPPAKFGETFVPILDAERLTSLRARIERLMVDGVWRTLQEIQEQTGGSLTGVSAKLRDLRKAQFAGGHKDKGRILARRRASAGLTSGAWEYRMR